MLAEFKGAKSVIISLLKQVELKGASGMIKFLAGSCLSGLGIVLKEPYAIKLYGQNHLLKQKHLFIVRPGSFFTSPYSRVLSAKI